jgi:hypothetical protein
MDLMILKKKIDGYRAGNGSIKNPPPELLLELRQTWEHYTGTPEQFRSELGMKIGTLRKLLVESKKLNHVLASAGAMELVPENAEENTAVHQGYGQNTASSTSNAVELVFDNGARVIRFPNVDLLVDFLRKSS